MVADILQYRVDRVTCPKRADISAAPATQTLLRDTMRGIKMKRIKLTKGQWAIVDDGDFEWINGYKWCAVKGGETYYAVRGEERGGIQRKFSMHRQIMEAPQGLEIDHVNHNGLDNRRGNMRLCTRGQHVRRCRPIKNKSSKYKGVRWDKDINKWRAGITLHNKSIHIGVYEDEKEAAGAYNERAKWLFGVFAWLNDV